MKHENAVCWPHGEVGKGSSYKTPPVRGLVSDEWKRWVPTENNLHLLLIQISSKAAKRTTWRCKVDQATFFTKSRKRKQINMLGKASASAGCYSSSQCTWLIPISFTKHLTIYNRYGRSSQISLLKSRTWRDNLKAFSSFHFLPPFHINAIFT